MSGTGQCDQTVGHFAWENFPTDGGDCWHFLPRDELNHCKHTVFSNWHSSCKENGTSPMVGSRNGKRDLQMFNMFASARENATIFAGAFISALLLVSAATSLPIA